MRQYFLRLGEGYIRLNDGSHTIGRSAQADVRLDDAGVSRIHAVIRVADGAVVIEDQSKNGLAINDRPIREASEVRSGDRITIAGSHMTLVVVDGQTATDSTTSRRVLAGDPGDEVLIGRTLAHRYTVRRLLGDGGMGRVFAAEQGALARTVAVKIMHAHLAHDEEVVSRFYTEAQAASRLNHPNSVSVIDFGKSDELLYLAMEFVEGVTLQEVLDLEGTLSPVRACDLTIGVLGALGEAHSLGVIHRDVKPANIMVKHLRSGHELVKVLDFGLARMVDQPQSVRETQPGYVFGTPEYMSPQQAGGEPLDGRADLYSLGVVLFQLLTGSLPYPGDDHLRVMLRHIRDPVPDPRDRSGGATLPDDLAQIVMRSLAKSPDDRFQSANEFQAALSSAVAVLRAQGAKCPKCGAAGPDGMHFCGYCGGTLRKIRPSVRPPPIGAATERGVPTVREQELEELRRWRVADGPPRAIRIVGEAGSGKTWLLEMSLARAASDGELVFRSGAHPSRAFVPLHAIADLATQMRGGRRSRLDAIDPAHPSFDEPLVAAGLRELAHPGQVGRDLADVVALALARIAKARLGSSEQRVVLAVDDVDLCDGATQAVLERLLVHAEGLPLRVVTAARRPGDTTSTLELSALAEAEAATWLRENGVVVDDELPSTLPLYLEQLRRHREGELDEEPLPAGPGDVIQQRLDQLGVSSRRVLQAIAVLGDRCELATLSRLVGGDDLRSLDELVERGLVAPSGASIVICHPLVRDVVEASMPAQARREMHTGALMVHAEGDAPLEVRAHHAFHGSEPEGALMMLNAIGAAATRRGDPGPAAFAYQRALEVARERLLVTGEATYERAVANAACQLAQALRDGARRSEADGVAVEAIALAPPWSEERARLLVVRATIASDRRAFDNAHTLLDEATTIASDLPDAGRLEGRIENTRATVLAVSGKLPEACDAYLSAASKLAPAEADAARMDAAALLVSLRELDRARALLESVEAPEGAAKARQLALLARVDEAAGKREDACRGYLTAAVTAERAGAWSLAMRCREDTERCRGSEPPP